LDDTSECKDVVGITGYVQRFVAAVSELKKAMEVDAVNEKYSDCDLGAETATKIDTVIWLHLKDLILVVYTCLGQFQGMQSTGIKNAATELISTFKSCDHERASQCLLCNSAVDVLVDVFTTCVQTFLGGEGHEVLLPQQRNTNLYDNLASPYGSHMDLTQPVNEPIADVIDKALGHMENNVDVTARYVKVRTRYHHDITSYLSKRGHIEMRHHQEMIKLARKVHASLMDLKQQEESLPLIDVFLESLDQDIRLASNRNTTYNTQVGEKVVEPLEQKTAESEKAMKELLHSWQKEQKKLSDSKAAMKVSRLKYRFVGQELTRVKSLLPCDPYGKHAEKRKKEISDLEMRWQETEKAYKHAVAVCNSCQYQVHKSAQQSILCACRRLVLDCDRSLKSKLELYFQLQHNYFLPVPDMVSYSLYYVKFHVPIAKYHCKGDLHS
jgi:hypothetical protein